MFISFFFATLILFMILAMFMGAPAVFSKKKIVERMIELLNLKPGRRIVDLGSGDGRLVISAGKIGLKAIGIEINPYLVLLSYFLIFLNRQFDWARVRWGSYWNVNLSGFDGVVVYGLPSMMKKLSVKLKKELKTGTPVVSNTFQIPDLKLIKTELVGKDRIYLYRV